MTSISTKHPWEQRVPPPHHHYISFSWSRDALTITPDFSPTFLTLIVTFSSSFPLFLNFPCVPRNPFPVHPSTTQGLSVPITTGPCSTTTTTTNPLHPRLTHSPLSLSLYQLGINLLKQRGSWRAAHREPCEVLPLHRYTPLPILRTTHSCNLFTTFPPPKQMRAQSIIDKTEECRERK